MLGFDESTIAYDLQRAHSADIWLMQMRFWFWGLTCVFSSFLVGNIMGVFEINVMGWLINKSVNLWDYFWH